LQPRASQLQHWLSIRGSQFLLIRIDMSHRAKEAAALTIASRRCRVRGCRLVIHVPESVTQGVNREVVVDSAELPFCALVFSPNKGGNVLEGPRRRERRNTTKHSAEKIYTNVRIIRFSAATDFCMTSSAPFAPRRVHFANARLKGGPAMPGRPYF
jgi:hypothetical protein